MFLSTAEFKQVTKDVMWKKPSFFFSDNLETSESDMNEGSSRWVREVGGQYYFLLPCSRRHSITRLHGLAFPRRNKFSGATTKDLMRSDAIPKPKRAIVIRQPGSF